MGGVFLGVDFHARTQTVSWCDTANGIIERRTLDHRTDDVRAFYQQFHVPAVVGLEATGYARWFHRLVGLEMPCAFDSLLHAGRRTIGVIRSCCSTFSCEEIFLPSIFQALPAKRYCASCATVIAWSECAPC